MSSVEWQFQAFERHMRKVDKVYERLVNSGAILRLQVSMQPTQSRSVLELGKEAPWVEFVVVMRRFLDEKSDLYFPKFLDLLQSDYIDILGDETISKLRAGEERLRRGPGQLMADDLPAAEVYKLIAEGDFFRNESSAKARLKDYGSKSLGGPLFWLLFYNYHQAAHGLLTAIRWMIKQIRAMDEYRISFGLNAPKVQRCIYCLSEAGDFMAEEHIISEKLGNYDIVLPRGYVCGKCNHGVLSELDNVLADWGPIAFMRVQYVPHTKDGKPQKANFQNLTLERPRPTQLLVTPKDRTGDIEVTEENPDGTIHFSINARGKWVDPKLIGRALYKIALGFHALDHGIEQTCDPKFDTARAFIRGDSGFPNKLLVFTESKPHPSFSVHYHKLDSGTPYFVDVYGIKFMFNLEPRPMITLADELAQLGPYEIWSLD